MVLEPLEERRAFGDLLSGQGWRVRLELRGDRKGPLTHLRPVLDRGAYLADHPEQLPTQLLEVGCVCVPVDLRVDH